MGEEKPPGMKGLTVERLDPRPRRRIVDGPDSTGAAVDPVADNGITRIRQMNPDLVGPARLDVDFQQGCASVTFPDAPEGDGRPTPPAPRGHLLAVRRVAADGGLNPPAVGLRVPVHKGQVALPHRAALELPGQSAMGFVGFGHNQQPGGSLVETVDDSGAQHAADPREIAAVVQQRVHQRAAGMARRRVDDQPRGLVDDQKRRVLMENLQRDRFGLHPRGLHLRKAQDDLIPRLHLASGRNRPAVDQNAPLADRPPDLRAGETDLPAGQKEIQAETVLLRSDREADLLPDRFDAVRPLSRGPIRPILRFIPRHQHVPHILTFFISIPWANAVTGICAAGMGTPIRDLPVTPRQRMQS